MDGKVYRKKYYLCNYKIYKQRFSTDCFSDYFNEQAKKTFIGINDYSEYATEKASICTFGVDDRKLLLFDNFRCWDEGCYMGRVSKEVIAQMRKSN